MRASAEMLLHHCTVFDGLADEPLPGAAIRIRDGRIADYGPEAAVRARVTPSCPDVDMGGAFVMAGLVNMHTHFSLSLPGPGGDAVSRLTAHALVLYMASGAQRTLNCGVTTVRCVAEKDHAEFAIRDAIDAGWLRGPRIFTAGRALVCTGGHGHLGTDTLECDGADDFRRGARRQISAGADLIKVMISGGIAGRHEALDTPQLTGEEMAAVIQTAHAWGKKVTAHAGPAGIIEQAVRLGLDCVEHGYQLTGEVARLMAERGTGLVPTLIVTRCGDFFDSLGVPEWMQRRSLDAGPRHIESYQLALGAGVTVMLGSDMPPFQAIDGTTATVRELEHMAAYGLTPTAALRAATVVPARWLEADDEIGSIAPGKHADLIALDRDPTRDVSALRSLRWVMKAGEVVRDDRIGLSV
jgi:imidazolonepropionase-like amidohydrolase